MTSKGTFTLPIKIRKLMGVEEEGDTLVIMFNPQTQQAVISKPCDFSEIQQMTAEYARKIKKPLTNVDEYYQAERVVKHGK